MSLVNRLDQINIKTQGIFFQPASGFEEELLLQKRYQRSQEDNSPVIIAVRS